MAWKCPECSRTNDDSSLECTCGYAFYKKLGVKPDATDEEVIRTYNYLLNVWNPASFSHDPQSQKKAEERFKEIREAYKNFKHLASNRPESKQRIRVIKVASFAVIIILFFVTLFVFLNISLKDKTKEEITTQKDVSPQPPSSNQINVQNISEVPKLQPADLSQGKGALPEPSEDLPSDLSPEETEERVIELVKKSHTIDRIFDVETLMKKWTDENSGKLQVIGWKAKKMDDQTYLVSYTASDGLITKGFYFDININTRKVQNIGNNPELQKKYGIQYNQ